MNRTHKICKRWKFSVEASKRILVCRHQKPQRLLERIHKLDAISEAITKIVLKCIEELKSLSLKELQRLKNQRKQLKLKYLSLAGSIHRPFVKQLPSPEIVYDLSILPEIYSKFSHLLTTFASNPSNFSKSLHQKGHFSPITCLSLSADNHYLLSGSQDSTIGFWDLQVPSRCSKIPSPSPISCLALNNKSNQVLSGSTNGEVIFWSFPAFDQLQAMKVNQSKINAVVYTFNDISAIIASEDHTLSLLKASDPWECWRLGKHAEAVLDVKTCGSNIAASSSADRRIMIWDLDERTMKYTLESHSAAVNCLAFSVNQLASAAYDKTMKLWSMNCMTCRTLELLGLPSALAYLSQGTHIAIADSANKILIISVSTLKVEKELIGHKDKINAICIGSDNLLYSASGLFSGTTDNSIRIWNVNTSKELLRVPGASDFVTCAILTSNEEFLVAGCSNSRIYMWDLSQARLVKRVTGHSHSVTCIICSGDGNCIVSGSIDMRIVIWNSELAVIGVLRGHKAPIRSITLAVDGRALASGGTDGELFLWDVEKRRLLWTTKAHSQEIRSLTLTNDYKFVVTFSSDRSIKVFCIKTQVKVQEYDITESAVSFFQLNPGQSLMVYSSGSTILIRSLHKKLQRKLESASSDITGLSISQTNKHIISSSSDRTIKIWNIKKLKLIATLTEPCFKITQESILMHTRLFLYTSLDRIRVRSISSLSQCNHSRKASLVSPLLKNSPQDFIVS